MAPGAHTGARVFVAHLEFSARHGARSSHKLASVKPLSRVRWFSANILVAAPALVCVLAGSPKLPDSALLVGAAVCLASLVGCRFGIQPQRIALGCLGLPFARCTRGRMESVSEAVRTHAGNGAARRLRLRHPRLTEISDANGASNVSWLPVIFQLTLPPTSTVQMVQHPFHRVDQLVHFEACFLGAKCILAASKACGLELAIHPFAAWRERRGEGAGSCPNSVRTLEAGEIPWVLVGTGHV